MTLNAFASKLGKPIKVSSKQLALEQLTLEFNQMFVLMEVTTVAM